MKNVAQTTEEQGGVVSHTLKPVTLGGWYEHEDGTVGEYRWHAGQLSLVQTVATWADVPERDYAADDQAQHAAKVQS